MKKAASVLFAWWFIAVGSYQLGGATHGPFLTKDQCEAVRKELKSIAPQGYTHASTQCWEAPQH